MIMKLKKSYESQKRKKWIRNEIYSSSRCLRKQQKAMPNDGQEMNFSLCESERRKGKDVRWHFDASRQIISIIFSFDADKVEEMNHDIIKIDWFRSPTSGWMCVTLSIAMLRWWFRAFDKFIEEWWILCLDEDIRTKFCWISLVEKYKKCSE